MNGTMWQIAILANVVIALAYLGIGIYVAPKFSFAAPNWGAKLARFAGLVFFITCAGTHLELAYHAAQVGPGPEGLDVGEWFVEWHGLLIHTVQGAAGWLFLVLAARYLSVKVYNREYYDQVINEQTTGIRQAQQEAERAREEATRANMAKTEFLSRMSHELRTPLNAILGFSQVLELSPLDSEDREGVAHISKAGTHLLALINDVLDLSRIEAGTMTISLEPVRVGELIDETLALVQSMADRRSVRLIVHTADCAGYVRADRQRSRQVLLNLLSNAIKYNRDGGEVRVICTRTGDGSLRLSVRDTGPGIDAARRQHLFEPFERLGAESSGVEGTGLGLALTKQLVETMGGAIGVDTAPGQGSTFWIDLPETQPPVDSEQPRALTPRSTETRPRTLLLVEDNLTNVHLVEAMLRRRPHISVMPAMQGQLAMDLAYEHEPDLVVLDLNLPDLPGREVLHRLKADPRTRHIPVVIASADETPGRLRQLQEEGAFAYVVKPLELQPFLDVVDAALAQRDVTSRAAAGR